MKKTIVAIAILTSITATMVMVADEDYFLDEYPPDDDLWPQFSTISMLVSSSDMAGIGTVLQRGYTNTFIVAGEPYEPMRNAFAILQVEDSFYGCTNQQIVMVDFDYARPTPPPLFTRIVFMVHSNYYGGGSIGDWSLDPESRKHENIPAGHCPTGCVEFVQEKRAWFPADADDGLVLDYTTNVIQTVRTERNWTNFYYVTRSAVTSASERVSNDSKHDLRSLIQFADPAQLLFMKNDPLFPVELKDLLPK